MNKAVEEYYVKELKKRFRARLLFAVVYWSVALWLILGHVHGGLERFICFAMAFVFYTFGDEYIKERYLFKPSDVCKGFRGRITHEFLVVVTAILAVIAGILDALKKRRRQN